MSSTVEHKQIKIKPGAEKILDHITQCAIVTDLDGGIMCWNKASEQVFGYTREEMYDQSLIKIYPNSDNNKFQADLEQLKKGKEIHGQWKSVTKNDEVVWVDVQIKPLSGKDGIPAAIIASAYEIQALKKIEQELEENKAQAQAILETTVDGIITFDEHGRILSFNNAASRIFGYEEEEVIGKNVKILMPDPHRSQHDGFIRRYYKTGEKRIIGQRRELTGIKKNGSLFPMELSVSEVKWDNTKIFTGVVNDISERRRLEKEILLISDEEQRSLGQDLHDGLGQMLTGITLICQNLARKLEANGIPGADEVQEISNLIKEADEYAKSLAHGLVHNFEEEGLQVALEQLRNQAQKFFNVNCTYEYKCEYKVVNSMQAMHLYRIAQEAISNAVKHGKADNIHISLAADNGTIKLSIEDDGIGFVKSHKSANRKGMGIQIMKYRANMMSGHLEILETEDKKTHVICSIPNASN